MEEFRLRQKPAPMQRLRRSTLGIGALLVVLLVGVLAYVKAQIPPIAQLLTREQAPVQTPITLPESLKAVARPYSELVPKPAPPVAQPLPKPPAPPPVAQPFIMAPPVQAQADPLPGFLDLMQKNQALTERVAAQQPPPMPPPPPQKPARQPWRIKPTDITLKKDAEKGGEGSKTEKEQVARKGEASKLITPAVWARPSQVWRTLYMDQKLAGRTLDAVNSDEPGLTRIELTVPVFDVAGYGVEILPKGAIAVVKQDGKPNYGASTLAVKLLQIRFPGTGGEVVKFEGSIGDENGANGMRGKTNNHYGKLLLATGINALVSLGSNSLAGTPGGYYANPAQQSARDISQSVSHDVRSLTEAQLKVPPTITKKAGEFVTIQLEENITFSHKPVVVR